MNVQIYATKWCRDCRQAKEFLDSHGIPYTEINVDADPAASAEVLRRVGKRAVPQLVIDGEWFQPYKPGRGLLYDELHQRLGIPQPEKQIDGQAPGSPTPGSPEPGAPASARFHRA